MNYLQNLLMEYYKACFRKLNHSKITQLYGISILGKENWHTKDVLKFYGPSFHQQHDLAMHICDQVCENQPSSRTNISYHNLCSIYTNMQNVLPQMQNLMGDLLKLTE